MRRIKIITSAGAWGYGPCSTLRVLLSSLSEFAEVDFVGQSVALDFALKHKDQFANVYYDYGQLETNYDLALSILDVDLLLWSKKFDIPAISIDNLYWLWDWNCELFEATTKLVESIDLNTDLNSMREALSFFGRYSDFTAIYTASEIVLWQRFRTDFPAKLHQFNNKVRCIDPLIDKSCEVIKPNVKNKILVSLSGMINPYVGISELHTYMSYVMRLLSNAIEKYEKLEFVFAVHDSVCEDAKKIFRTEKVYSFGHSEFINALSESLALIAPSGMATIFESLAYGVPMFTLPEQHDGNFSNYYSLWKSSNEHDIDVFREIFPEAMLSTRFEDSRNYQISDIYDFYKIEQMKCGSELIKSISETLANFIGNCIANSHLMALCQKERVLNVIGNFDGVQQAVEIVRKYCLKEGKY